MNLSLDSSSTESDVFNVERSLEEVSPIKNNTRWDPQFGGAIRSYGKRGNHNLFRRLSGTTNCDARLRLQRATVPYGFGSQHPIVPTRLNGLNWPPNPFNVLATMAVIQADETCSPQSPELSIPSPISTTPMNVITIEGWHTTHTTTDNATFYTDDEPRREY